MSKGYILRSGSSGANISVKNYASKNNLPSKALENTIGVISNVPISKYDFTGIQPENPIEGETWIKTGAVINQFTFNLIRKNELLISPIIVWQYVKGKWSSKDSYIFKDGKWINITVYLIENGNFTSYIPQFTFQGLSDIQTAISRTSSYMDIQISSRNSGYIEIKSPPIRFEGYKKMFIECETGQGIERPVKVYCTSLASGGTYILTGEKRRVEIDLTDYKATDSFGFSVYKGTSGSSVSSITFRIYSIWLE